MRISVFFVLFFSALLLATEYGRTKITGVDGDWWVIHSTHFDVYFEQGTECVAESTVVIAEREIRLLGNTFDYLPSRPVPIVLYRSPARFRQTTLLQGDMGESVGGFTEFAKGRIAVPFAGVWSEYRHVLAHELNHAYVFDMLYRRELMDIIKSRVPLWVMEGLAEYTSLGWDNASDIEFRDMVINNQIVPVEQLNNRNDYIVYREGQALYHFMNERYGRERYLDFVRHMRDKNGIDGALRDAFGMTVRQFSERFVEWAREKYWGSVSQGESPTDIGSPIMQGEGDRASRVVMAGPVFSPDGSKIAGVEYYHARFSGVVRSAVDGEEIYRPVSGGGIFEEGAPPAYRSMAFSPGSDSVVVVYHRQVSDGMKIAAIGGDPVNLPFEFGLIRDPVWSPEGGQIAFSALRNANLDIWLYDTTTGELRRLSDTEQGEHDLWWGDDGILCVSENPPEHEKKIQLWQTDGTAEDLYTSSWDLSYPMQTPQGILFISDEAGNQNFYLAEPDSTVPVRLTDLYVAPRSPSWADSAGVALFQSTDWFGPGLFVANDLTSRQSPSPQETVSSGTGRDVSAAPESYTTHDWRIEPYNPKFSLDMASATAGFDSYSGLTGNTFFIFSDVLAYHQMGILTNFSGQVTDMDLALMYTNLQHRLQAGGSAYRFTSRYVFIDSTDARDYVRDINAGVNVSLNYPLTKAVRTSLTAGFRRVSREGLWASDLLINTDIFSLSGNLVYDNALWGAVGPRVGNRMSVSVEYAPPIKGNADYLSALTDLRKYIWLSSEITLAARLAGGISVGQDRQRFFLGGAIPHRRSTGEVESVGDVYQFYSSYADLLRGWDYVSLSGTRYGVASIELRFPLINTISLAAPIPMTFTRGRGVVFSDLGFASDDLSAFKGASTTGGYHLQDIKMSFGTGFRLNVGFFVLKTDVAWRTDLAGVSQKPKYYFTMSAEF